MTETRSSIRNLEAQVVQLSKRVTETPPSTLPSNTEENPKRECKAITIPKVAKPRESKKAVISSEEDLARRPLTNKEFSIEELKESEAHIETIEIPWNLILQFMSSDEDSSSDEDEDIVKGQVARYLGAIMKLNALVQQKLPQKKPDPRKFLIPCTIGTMTFEKALCDLGSRINLMSLSVMEKLRIFEVQAARISLEMADKSMKQAYGLVEDVLMKVEGLYIPADFIILDTGKDEDESIILGRPFLATARAVIDVDRGELVLQLNDDYLVFKAQGSSSIIMERKREKLLSIQSQTEPHTQLLSLVLGGHH
ncbi:Retrotransposon gag protein [Arachis hypogaea]|nr:Retrotransposon gag protein [Arachis hypogaea]